MPKVKLLSRYVSPLRIAHPGETIDVGADEAKDLIAGHYAEAVGPQPKAAGKSLAEDTTDGSEENSGADGKPHKSGGGKKAS